MPANFVSTGQQLSPGVFGKVPQLGDFIRWRMPAYFADPWDAWLQQGLYQLQASHSKHWLQYFLNCPIWHFVLSANVVGTSPWCGAMMPSVDAVGRYYPITIACRLPLTTNPLSLASCAQVWFQKVEHHLLQLLDDDFSDLSHWDQQLITELNPIPNASKQFQPQHTAFGEAWQLGLCEGLNAALWPEVLDALLLQRLGNYSLWWAQATESNNANVLFAHALPSPTQFCGLIHGDWQATGWASWPVVKDDNPM